MPPVPPQPVAGDAPTLVEATATASGDAARPSASPPPGEPPRIRSYVLRAGRLGPGQRRAIETLGAQHLLPYRPEPLDLERVYGRPARVVLDIGFGMGDATAQMAAAAPELDVLGVEVHPPGVGALLKQIGERGLANVRIVQHDVVDVLQHMLSPASLHGAQLHFPDPWHKTRHHKRRLVQPPFAALLASRLMHGSLLHCATDWAPYAEHMLAVLSAEPMLVNTVDGYAPRPVSRPLTKFEQRGLRLGHGVWDLVFRRVESR